jgi:hypothetical protein
MERRDFPAPLSLLDRVLLEIDYLRRGERLRLLRHTVTKVELAHQELRAQLERRLGPLQREAESLRSEVKLLETRLTRLLRVSRPLSDEELDAVEDAERCQEAGWSEPNGRSSTWRANGQEHYPLVSPGAEQELLRRLYRTLARSIHPDLARDQAERAEREQLMRLVNQAWERRDLEQLQRLAAVWTQGEETAESRDLDTLRHRVAQRELEEMQLLRRLRELERSETGQLIQRGPDGIARYLARQEALLRHEIAVLRLRRRRLMRLIEERRRELSIRASLQLDR